MDPKEVLKFLKETEEGKKLLSELVEKHESLDGLKSKNSELIASNKKLKKEKEEAVSKVSELESEIEDFEQNKGEPDKKAQKEIEKLKKENETLKIDLDKKISESKSDKIDRAVVEAISKVKIAPQHSEMVKAFIKSTNKIEIDETDMIPKISGKDLNQFMSEWSQTDSGKQYVAASQNTGGGAQGGSKPSGDSGDTSKLSAKARLTLARQQAHSKKD